MAGAAKVNCGMEQATCTASMIDCCPVSRGVRLEGGAGGLIYLYHMQS